MGRSLLVLVALLYLAGADAHARGSSRGGGSKSSHASASSYRSSSGSSHSTRSYVRRNGTYVAPSGAKNPNKTKLDNYSTRGNVNPYSGKTGSKTPY